MRVLSPVVEPASHLSVIAAAQVLQRSAIGSQPVRHYRLGPTMLLHRLLQDFEGGLAISDLGDDAIQPLALVIDSALEIVLHAALSEDAPYRLLTIP